MANNRKRAAARAGRKKGVPNLKKTETGVKNQYGVEFTRDEKRLFENAVRYVNRKRKGLLDSLAGLPRVKNGKPTGQTVGEMWAMRGENTMLNDNPIITKRSTSLQNFKSKGAFDAMMKYLERAKKPDYIDKSMEIYQANHIKALKNVFGADADPLIREIKSMDARKYLELVMTNDDMEIGHVYTQEEYTKKLNSIRKAMKLKTVEA